MREDFMWMREHDSDEGDEVVTQTVVRDGKLVTEAIQPPATPQEPEQAQTLNDVFDVFETWARRKGATDTSSVSLGFWAFNEFHAIIGQPLRDWLLSRRASTPSPEGQTTWKDKIAEYRALIVDMQTGTQVRSLRASELREVMAIQGTLRVLLRELDQRFPAPPTPEGTEL